MTGHSPVAPFDGQQGVPANSASQQGRQNQARTSPPSPRSTTNENEQTQVFVNELMNEVESYQADELDREDSPVDIGVYLSQIRQARRRLYPLFLSRGEFGNAHSGRITLIPEIDPHQPSYTGGGRVVVSFPVSRKVIGGCQMYTSDSRDQWMRQARPHMQQDVLNLLPILRNLFVPHPDRRYIVKNGEERARQILLAVGEVLDSVINESCYQYRNPVRLEQFFLSDDVHSDDELTWATTGSHHANPVYLSDTIRIVDQRELFQFYSRIRDFTWRPLSRVLGQPGQDARNYVQLRPPVRAALYSCAEALTNLFGGPITVGMMHQAYARKLRQGLPLQPPRVWRKTLTRDEVRQTLLQYGVDARLYPAGAKYSVGMANSPQMEALVQSSAMFEGNLRCPMAYLVAESNLQKLFHRHSVGLLPGEEDLVDTEDESEVDLDQAPPSAFEVPDYDALAALTSPQRAYLLENIARELIELYDREWLDLINRSIWVKKQGRRDSRIPTVSWLNVEYLEQVPQCLEELPGHDAPSEFHYPAEISRVPHALYRVPREDANTVTDLGTYPTISLIAPSRVWTLPPNPRSCLPKSGF